MTPKNFTKGARVIASLADGRRLPGVVTSDDGRNRNIKADNGQMLTDIYVNRLRLSEDRVVILESRLDRSLRSVEREYGLMFKRWLAAYDQKVFYEKVHTIRDMRFFLRRREVRSPHTRFIHICAHGERHPISRKAALKLTIEYMDLHEHADAFKGLDGKIIIFSCCELGGDLATLARIKEISGAQAVFAYRKSVSDYYTNICDGMLFDRLLRTTKPPVQILAQVNKGLWQMGIHREPGEKHMIPLLVEAGGGRGGHDFD